MGAKVGYLGNQAIAKSDIAPRDDDAALRAEVVGVAVEVQVLKNDVRDFLKSIFDDHYIGALLLWDIEDTDKEQCGMIRIEGSYPEKLKGDKIILDGQQRITSLHYAINAPDKTDEIKDTHPGFFYINFGKYFLDPKISSGFKCFFFIF